MLTLLAQLNLLHACDITMAEPLDPNDLVTLEELAISNMWENAALHTFDGWLAATTSSGG